MDQFRKVHTGEPMRIPAKAYNAFVDAALGRSRDAFTRPGRPLRENAPDVVLIKNESGASRSRFDVLGISGPIISRDDNDSEFKSRIALRGTTPTTATHAGKFAILAEPLIDDAIGRAHIAGVTIARVRMVNEAHTAADVDDGETAQLASGESGAVSLLWVEPVDDRDDPEIAWCIIRFGGGGGGGADVRRVFPALLSHVQQYDDVLTALPAYTWAEAELAGGAAQVMSGGRTGAPPGYTAENLQHVGSDLGAGILNADAPQLVFPEDGSLLPGPVTPGSPDTIEIEFEWTAEDGGGTTSYWLGVGEPPPPSSNVNLYQNENDELGLVTTHAVTGIPADGRTIYVRVWNDTHYNDYSFTIEPEADRRALGTEDINAIERGETAPVPPEYDNTGADWVPAAETALDHPILVLLLETLDGRFLFVRGGGGSLTLGETSYWRYVYDVDWDTEACELTVTYHWREIIEVTFEGQTYYWEVQDHDTDPT